MLINMILGACTILALIGYVFYRTSIQHKTWDEATQQMLTEDELREREDRFNRRMASR